MRPERKILWILEIHVLQIIHVINCICAKCFSLLFRGSLTVYVYNEMEQYEQLYDSERTTTSNLAE